MAITTGNLGRAGSFVINTREFERALNQYVGGMSNVEAKKAILRRSAAVVAYNVRRLPRPKTEISDPVKGQKYHLFYSGSGFHRREIAIYKGNLLKSTKYYFNRYQEFEIGPKVIRGKLSNIVGKTVKTSSGFYASMVYGSAENYRNIVIVPELTSQNVLTALQESFRKHHERQARANGLQP